MKSMINYTYNYVLNTLTTILKNIENLLAQISTKYRTSPVGYLLAIINFIFVLLLLILLLTYFIYVHFYHND